MKDHPLTHLKNLHCVYIIYFMIIMVSESATVSCGITHSGHNLLKICHKDQSVLKHGI